MERRRNTSGIGKAVCRYPDRISEVGNGSSPNTDGLAAFVG